MPSGDTTTVSDRNPVNFVNPVQTFRMIKNSNLREHARTIANQLEEEVLLFLAAISAGCKTLSKIEEQMYANLRGCLSSQVAVGYIR